MADPSMERRLAPLRGIDKVCIGLLLATLIGFGVMVVIRSAYLQRRMTDAEVLLFSGWAVRTGADLYEVSDSNGMHYVYPPMFAVFMAPLAAAPPGEDASWMLPYPAGVIAILLINLLLMWLTVHWLARALEEHDPDPLVRSTGPRDRRYWAARVWPLVICAADLGAVITRGQTGMLILASISAMILLWSRQRRVLAGMVLAFPICIKLFPGLLALEPLRRRDPRIVGGLAVGMLLGVVVIPVAAFGPEKAWQYTAQFANVVVAPALGLGDDTSRARELVGFAAKHNHSIQGVLHAITNSHIPFGQRPAKPETWIRVTHVAVSLLLVGVTMLAARRASIRGAANPALLTTLVVGALSIVMVVAAPVCHQHYYSMTLVSMTALVFINLRTSSSGIIHGKAWVLIALYLLLTGGCRLPGMQPIQDYGNFLLAGLGVWGVTVWMLGRLASVPAQAAQAARA